MKKILIALLLILSIAACGSSAPAAEASTELTLQEKFDIFLASEHDATFSFDIVMNDKAVNYTIWQDGVGAIYDADPRTALTMIDARSPVVYERFQAADLDDLNLFYTLVDDRNHERVLYSYQNGELWYDAADYEREIVTYEELTADVYETAYSTLDSSLQNIFADSYTMTRDGDIFDITAWTEHGAAFCEDAAGDPELTADWIGFRESIEQLTGSMIGLCKNGGADLYINFYFVDENDHSRRLLTIIDGKCMSDASGVAR